MRALLARHANLLTISRAAIEEQYARSLQKLNAKAEKTGDAAFGYSIQPGFDCDDSYALTSRSLNAAWTRLVLEFKERADMHLQISDTLKKQVCDPLSAFAGQSDFTTCLYCSNSKLNS